jgi:hypothetical protein
MMKWLESDFVREKPLEPSVRWDDDLSTLCTTSVASLSTHMDFPLLFGIDRLHQTAHFFGNNLQQVVQ